MSGIIDQWSRTRGNASVIIDVVSQDTLVALIDRADIAECLAVDASKAVGVGGNRAVLQALVVV